MNEEIVAADNKAHIENENLRIDYTNNKEGMRQDFIVKNKPEGEGKLRLNLSADTKLKMIVGADALMFKNEEGIDKMKYSALKCWDANGRELRAYFEKDNYELRIRNYELESKSLEKEKIRNSKFVIPNSFSIVVNDEDAVYPITIDPLSTSPSWSAESDQADAQFGSSVATAGDVNGDGFSDVIVGASYYDNGQTDEGRIYVYHGSATGLSAAANWTAESDQASARMGFSVSTAGDVNGDGYSDIIASAVLYDNGSANEGGVFVWYGSASGLGANGTIANADWSAESNQTTAQLGWSVSTAGDVNGDGYSDVITGARLYDNGQTDEGRVFIWFGSASGPVANGTPGNANWSAESNQSNSHFGMSVSTAGDVNGDGYSDVIIGSQDYDNGQTDEGRTFLWFGSATGPTANGTPLNANWSGESNQTDASYGNSVATAGDINGDGYSDIIIGASLYDSVQTDEGRVYIYNGSSSGPSLSANRTIEINQDSANFGNCVAPAGDVNGDGYSDVIIGAPNFDSLQNNEGRAYVYFGGSSGLSKSADWTARSNQADANFGNSVATAGDINGDGYSDVIVGAPLFDNGQTDEGEASVYNGSPNGLSTISNWSSNNAGFRLGTSVSPAGDVNGDGYNDVIIGDYDYSNGQSSEGGAFVFYGSSTGLSASFNWKAESDQVSAFLSICATAGDVNGDGYSDIICGAYQYDSGETDEGKVFVWYGSSSGLGANGTPANADWSAESNQANANFGNRVSTAGDVNGDGYSDVIVGSDYYSNGESNEGKVFVWYGSSSGLGANGTPANADWSAESNQANANLGYSVSSAGDVNGDGYSDIIVGVPYYDNGQANEGRAYVYHGSATGLSISVNRSIEVNQDQAFFGKSVSSAGDVNGDGYSDVIVGADYYDNGQIEEGRAYVYQGSATGISGSAIWTAESNQVSARFGSSVSTAGDVNGDGYSDVIVGASDYDNGQNLEGRAYVYHGSATGLSASANWTDESDQANARFGNSVSTAGDVNGDGFSDIIVGAYQYSPGGKAFVYYGNDKTGLRSTVQQYQPGTNNIIYSGGLSGTSGQVRLNIFGKSSYGRADGKIVYEYMAAGTPFSSGSTITNSVSSSGSGTNTDLGTSVTGVQLNKDASGLLNSEEYKWRARVQYNPVNNPYQMFGPWKYYTNYLPVPFGCFKAMTTDIAAPAISFTDIPDTSSLINKLFNNVAITDASGVEGAVGKRPRIYYKKISQSNTYIGNTNATSGWKYVEANESLSPFSFTIDYSKLNGGKSYGDTIQYFVLAQDVRFGGANVGINSGTFALSPVSVSLDSSAFPVSGTIKSFRIIDNAPPVISYTVLGDVNNLTNRSFPSVTITDSAGVQGTTGTRPRVYYKKKTEVNVFNDNTNATTGWKYAQASGSTSPFTFTINYSLLNTAVSYGDSVQYFVTAQDVYFIPNISINSGIFAAVPSSVNLTGTAFPVSGTINSYKIIDNTAPAISFTNLADTAGIVSRTLRNVVITDANGVEGTAGIRPRIYFKKRSNANTFADNTNSTNGWKYAEASGAVSPFTFTLNYSLLNGSVAETDTIQYFVTAQDIYSPPNIRITTGTFASAPSSVNLTSAAFPITGTIKSYKILVQSKSLFLTTLIQGFYDAGTDFMVADTVTVYLRNSISPFNIVDTSKVFLGPGAMTSSGSEHDARESFGGFGVCSFDNATNGVPYYIQLNHRNSIETWSGTTQSFFSSQLVYDFTTAANKAFGDNMTQVNSSPVRFAMFGGDVNQDGTIDASDVSNVDNDSYSSLSGYVLSDLTGDDFVDAADVSIVDNNAAASVSAITP